MVAAALLLLALQGSLPADTLPPPPAPPAGRADAYADPAARELVRLARARREQSDRTITAYETLARERISAGVRALRRDRTLFRREMAARILWRRDGVGRVEVLGARQVVPVAAPVPHVPGQPGQEASQLAFDPAKEWILRGFGDQDEESLIYPLQNGSEAHYRFAAGDTTRIRLSGGRTVRLVELRVIPRRQDGRLLRGSIWLDADSHAAVRAVFQLARPLDVVHDLGDEDVPGWIRPLEMDLRFLTIDYGLWEGRWWLPRLISLEGEARIGSLATLPVRFERSYEGYRVEGEGGGVALPVLAMDTAAADGAAAGDSLSSVTIGATRSGVTVQISRRCNDGSCWRYRTEQAPDSVLLSSEHLGPSVYAGGEELISEQELRELADVLGMEVPGQSPWHLPHVRVGYLSPGLLRYNRVEGLALGARVDADFGPLAADATLWLPTAAWEPAGEVGLRHERFGSAYRAAGYRRLATVEPAGRGLGLGSSLSALLLGRDDHDYYRTLGAELTGHSTWSRAWEYRWRAYAERQSLAEKNTDFSLPRLWDGDRAFPAGIQAAEAEQVGASLALGWTLGENPAAFRWGGRLGVDAEAGDYRFVRPSASLFTTFPLPGRLVAALEAAGGTTAGESPLQGEWFLGGPATVRGYGGGSRIHGPAYWRGRAEVGTSFPAARVALFSDAGWAGVPAEVELDPALLSAGAGVSLLDGLLRADLSRALRGPRGWRLDVYFDALF